MPLFALGINHKTAAVDVREQLSFTPERLEQALHQARSLDGVEEMAILSTCNRTELYVNSPVADESLVLEWLEAFHSVSASQLRQSIYVFRDESAARHMMNVACGLDSMVLGEPQILGQLKDAHARAKEAGTVGGSLDRLFQHTFSVAKRVRTQTAIGESPVSVAYAAVRLAGRIFSQLEETTALLVGAGETVELLMRHLQRAGVRQFIVANRTLSRGQALAQTVQGTAIGLSEIPEHLHRADIVMTSTASSLPLVGKGMVERALRKRKHKPIFMVDLAVPRDVEMEVGELADVFLYTVDDLQGVIEEGMKSRSDAAEEARQLIETGSAEYMQLLRAQDAVSVLRQFRENAEYLREQEIEKSLRALKRGDDPEQVMRMLAHGLTNKLIHQPTVQVRRASAEGRSEVSDWLRDLYQLSDAPEDTGSRRE